MEEEGHYEEASTSTPVIMSRYSIIVNRVDSKVKIPDSLVKLVGPAPKVPECCRVKLSGEDGYRPELVDRHYFNTFAAKDVDDTVVAPSVFVLERGSDGITYGSPEFSREPVMRPIVIIRDMDEAGAGLIEFHFLLDQQLFNLIDPRKDRGKVFMLFAIKALGADLVGIDYVPNIPKILLTSN